MLEQSANMARARDWLLVAVMALAFVVPYHAVAARPATASTAEGDAATVAAVTFPRIAHLSVNQESGHGSLRWHDGSDRLLLRSDGDKGVRVVSVQPDGLFGLRESDVILDVDGHTVKQIGAVLNRLRARKPSPAKLRLLRDGSSRVITLTADQYQRILPPPPPAPPQPPAQSTTTMPSMSQMPPMPPQPTPSMPPMPPQPVSSMPTMPPMPPAATASSSGFHASNVDVNDSDANTSYGIVLFGSDSVLARGTPSDLAAGKREHETHAAPMLWFRHNGTVYVTDSATIVKQAGTILASYRAARRDEARMDANEWRVKGPLEGLRAWQRSVDVRIHELHANPGAPAAAARVADLNRQKASIGSRITGLEHQLVAQKARQEATLRRTQESGAHADAEIEQLIARGVATGTVRRTAI